VKGVNFFGPKSEYIISGSDCGNIFIWDKNTGAIVQWMTGDKQGVVSFLFYKNKINIQIFFFLQEEKDIPFFNISFSIIKVNCLEGHPHIPVLATSGLDYDVKIWVPSCKEPPMMKSLTNVCTTKSYFIFSYIYILFFLFLLLYTLLLCTLFLCSIVIYHDIIYSLHLLHYIFKKKINCCCYYNY